MDDRSLPRFDRSRHLGSLTSEARAARRMALRGSLLERFGGDLRDPVSVSAETVKMLFGNGGNNAGNDPGNE